MRTIPGAAALIAACMLLCSAAAPAAVPFSFGAYAPGPNDGITDVPGVEVGHITKMEGTDVRTGATVVLANADPWNRKVSASAFAFNGNGEMTGTHWVNEAGYLETPVVLTDTLDVGRADDGTITWMMRRYPQIGKTDDVPLPVVAECDDQLLNDITGRHVTANDVVAAIDSAHGGQFSRGSVGAGTGMKAFGFKAGIGSASRVLPPDRGGYTVGVLVNDNTGSTREQLMIDGVHVGAALRGQYRMTYPKRVSLHGRMASGSIVVIVATNAPLDSRQLHALALRASIGMGRTGLTSDVGSGDLFLAFSTGHVFTRTGNFRIAAPTTTIVTSDDTLDALYRATAEATEGAIYDALFNARTMTGRGGATVYGLPVAQVMRMLKRAVTP